MKLIRVGEPGHERPGVLVGDDQYLDVGDDVEDFDRAFFAGGGLERLGVLLQATQVGRMPHPLGGRRLGAPVARPGKVVGIGLNYVDHVKETGADAPDEPVIFFKGTDTVVGPNDDVVIPRGSEKTDWEVELAVLIGRHGRYLANEDEAATCIAGYAISNDVSEREFQLERGGQWVKGKSCETFNPLGPWIATADEVPDPQRLRMWLDVNGQRMQDGSTANMIFGIRHIIWYLSQFMVLEPGDVINTGTPAGVGMGRGVFLATADVMRLGIDGLGEQQQTCRPATVERLSQRRPVTPDHDDPTKE